MRTAICIAIAVLLGAALGRASAPSSPPTPDPHPGHTRKAAGVGVGFPRTRAGAALAAASYQQAFADEDVLGPGELRRRIEAIATPAFAPTMLAANRPGTARLARGAFGAGVRAGMASVFLGVPVAYRVLSYSPSRAVVRTWGFTLLGNVSTVEPSAYFGLARTVLAWSGDRWRIAATRASFGPTPQLVTPRSGGEGLGLLELSREMHRYGVAP